MRNRLVFVLMLAVLGGDTRCDVMTNIPVSTAIVSQCN